MWCHSTWAGSSPHFWMCRLGSQDLALEQACPMIPAVIRCSWSAGSRPSESICTSVSSASTLTLLVMPSWANQEKVMFAWKLPGTGQLQRSQSCHAWPKPGNGFKSCCTGIVWPCNTCLSRKTKLEQILSRPECLWRRWDFFICLLLPGALRSGIWIFPRLFPSPASKPYLKPLNVLAAGVFLSRAGVVWACGNTGEEHKKVIARGKGKGTIYELCSPQGTSGPSIRGWWPAPKILQWWSRSLCWTHHPALMYLVSPISKFRCPGGCFMVLHLSLDGICLCPCRQLCPLSLQSRYWHDFYNSAGCLWRKGNFSCLQRQFWVFLAASFLGSQGH